MPEITFRAFVDWKLTFLASRGLHYTDRRALHQYRLSDAEFTDLEQLLRKWLGLLLDRFGLSNVPQLAGFSALFVLFAAEWWRRRFDGGHWTWDPILEAIGADPDDWSQGQRSECVQYGLRDWGLEPRSTGGLRFLGSIAVQGGLPLRLLAEDRGGIGHLLGQVLRQAGSAGVTQSDLLTWIESLQTMLPRSYRQSAIYALLADTAWTVLRLKEEGGLTPGIDAIATLDATVPAWRDRFPLRVDDDHARGLIERLVKDAALVRTQRGVVPIFVERRLVQDENRNWSIQSVVSLPESIGSTELAALFADTIQEMPRFADFSLIAGADQSTTAIRRMAGHDRYRIERAAWGHPGEAATREYLLRMSAADGRIWSTHAPRGEAMDEELPWVFGNADQSHRFLRQGSGSVGPLEAFVAVPESWTFAPIGESTLLECGVLAGLERKLIQVRGAVELHDQTGITCRVRTGQAGATEESIEWRGERVWLDLLSPTMAFRGRPQVYRVDDEGRAQRLDGAIGWSVPGARLPAGPADTGPLLARYPATGEVRHRCRILSLPGAAGFELKPRSATEGEIRFTNWGAMSARVISSAVDGAARVAGGVLTLDVATRRGEKTPEQLDIEVFWSHTPVPVRLRVPFPARGVRLFDGAGIERRPGANLCAQQLTGVRLLVLSEIENARLTLEIRGFANQPPRIHMLRCRSGAFGVEARLQDYATDIQHTLAFDDSPDAKVRVLVRIGGTEHFRLDVARYAAKLELTGPDVCLDDAGFATLTPEEAEALPVLALRLEQPGDEPLALAIRKSENVATGAWAFQPEAREPGAWLIFSGPGACLPFRPTLWPVKGDLKTESRLAAAIACRSEAERYAALDACIEAMAADYSEPSWVEVERLFSQIGHLPLVTLDVWRRFVKSSDGMAAFAMRFSTWRIDFLSRFSQELPFAWECVSFGSWSRAAASLACQLERMFGQDAGSIVFKTHLQDRFEAMGTLCPTIADVLGIACARLLGTPLMAQVKAFRAVGQLEALSGLFEGSDSPMMRLLRRQSTGNVQWPIGLVSVFEDRPEKPLDVDLLYIDRTGPFRMSVLNLPIALAIDVASGDSISWCKPKSVELIRTHRVFDPEWFDEAYRMTIARCLARGVIEP